MWKRHWAMWAAPVTTELPRDPRLRGRQRLPIRDDGTSTEEKRCSQLASLPFSQSQGPGVCLPGLTAPPWARGTGGPLTHIWPVSLSGRGGVWAGHVTQDSQSEPTHPTGAAGPPPTQTKQVQSMLKALNWFSVTCNQRSLRTRTCCSFIAAVSKPSRFWRNKAEERRRTPSLTGKASGSSSPSVGPQWQLRDL